MAKILRPACLMVIVTLILSLSLIAMPVSAATESTTIFSDDMEDGTNGWTSSGFWHQIENAENIYVYNVGGATPDDYPPDDICPDLVTLPDMDESGHAYLPQATSGDTSWWFGVDELGSYIDTESDFLANVDSQGAKGGGYSYGGSHGGNLDSPLIDVAGLEDATLSFWTWWEIEGIAPVTYDVMIIYISTDEGATWDKIDDLNPTGTSGSNQYENYSSGGRDSTPVWVEEEFDITAFLGDDVDTIQLRFAFDTYDRQYNGFRGWFIDDITVTGTPGAEAPEASFTASPTMGDAPLTVQFKDRSSGDVDEYYWSFGDGEHSSSRHPTHTYQNEGVYSVTLEVSGDGSTDRITKRDIILVDAQTVAPSLVVRDLQVSTTYAQPGQELLVTAKVYNEGGSWGSDSMNLLINGYLEQSASVGVAPGTAQTVSFTVYRTTAGEYQVTFGDATANFFIMEQAEQATPASGLLAGGEMGTGGLIAIICIGVIVVAGIVIVFLVGRRT